MHHVIIRDDDTNALTPVECLERLYRPFLERSLPVNLAVIPRVRTDATRADGKLERFLWNELSEAPRSVPIAANTELVRYLHDNPGFHLAQHGYHHTLYEFDSDNPGDIRNRLEQGAEMFSAAGFSKPTTFVAPHDKISRASFIEVAKKFRTVSSGWFELRRLPPSWWPRYLLKKAFRQPHWRIGQTLMLSHPGCLLSCNRSTEGMLEDIKCAVRSQSLTVLVTHWWEYFRDGKPVEPFLQVLHDTAAWLASERDVRVISFDDLSPGTIAKSQVDLKKPVTWPAPVPARD